MTSTVIKRANAVASAEGGLYRVKPIRGARGQCAILCADTDAHNEENRGVVLWQGPTPDAIREVRRMSRETRSLREVAT